MRLMDTGKTLWTALATALTFVAFWPYIRGILRGGVRPHVFSWVIWGITTTVVFFAQLQAGGGVGAWATGVSGAITFFIALLAFLKRGDLVVTRTDWAFFLAALSSLPLWYLTADPTWAVVVLTTVDLLGFGPTLRQVYTRPHSESALFYGLFLVRNAVSIPALETFSLATLLFPIVIGLACGALVGLLLWRRRVVSSTA